MLKNQIQQELETARYMRRSAIRQQLEKLEQHSLTLTDGLGTVHPTATDMARLAVDSIEVQQLTSRLERASEQECYAMCPPIYRDALVFYNAAGELINVLNICFECRFMQTSQKEHVEADMATYDFLRDFLIRLGHPIEDTGWLSSP